jgi:GH25 family lysozyme M1 (1,4-beta-N-acetylmuramidase)
MILGIDVCHWDVNVNWGTLKSNGVEFVFIKATQGNYLTDPMLNKHCADANKAGLIVGLYHWCDPIVKASSQAAYFLNAVSGFNGCRATMGRLGGVEQTQYHQGPFQQSNL